MRLTTGLWGLLLLAGTAGAADLYKWKDANGVTHYSERPPSGQKYEARRIDNRGDLAVEETDAATPAEPPRCTQARQNLQALSSDRPVMQDTDGDGKPDAKLDDSQREVQRNLADAAVKAYCPAAGN
ncbi:MAG TPA: DUF4124 domain-containing protein [Stenotrophomonas sp.]|nr:DUF4124 domain-containing protein [Stenotrophomonas sp.]